MDKEYLEYRMACTEVLEVLKHMSKKDVSKIPDKVIRSLKMSKRFDYRFNYDKTKKLNEQNLSKKAKAMLAIFYRDYWAENDIKEIILAKEKFDRKKGSISS